jgi:hypothetical protein
MRHRVGILATSGTHPARVPGRRPGAGGPLAARAGTGPKSKLSLDSHWCHPGRSASHKWDALNSGRDVPECAQAEHRSQGTRTPCHAPSGEPQPMSKHETPMIQRYWQQTGGTLFEEYLAVPRGKGIGRRLIDAVIIVDGVREIALRGKKPVSLDGHDVIVVQAKANRLGMYLMGQALFSRLLIERQHALRTIALCAVDDTVLRPLAERFGIEVVVDTAGAAETLADTTPECAGQAWDQPVRTDQHPYDVRKSSERGGDGGNSAAYLVARLKRDAPEICDRSAFSGQWDIPLAQLDTRGDT